MGRDELCQAQVHPTETQVPELLAETSDLDEA